ncbi:MAG: LCP family protein [Anaerolineae bacterium]|nr:LCP family protein [Thermoflexales bacterium]MDW8396505.1 LCP family protein [Anaerolineae bacterium]
MATQTGRWRRQQQRNRGCAVLVGVALVTGALVFGALVLPRLAPSFDLLRLASPATPTPPPLLSPAEIGLWRGEERVNLLLLGVDARAEARNPSAQPLVALVLVTLDPVSKSGGVLSLPPELHLPQPGRESATLSAAFDAGGAAQVCQALEFNLGMPVRRYAVVGAGALSNIVDLIGGVEVYLEAPISPSGDLGTPIGAGWQTLNGAAALAYLRQSTDTFDAMRRQHTVLFAALSRLRTTDAVVKLLPRTAQLLQSLGSSLSTNLNPAEIAQLTLLAREIPETQFARLAVDEQATRLWKTPLERSVLVPVRDRLRSLRQALQQQPAAQITSESEPGVRLRIENGTQQRGLAARTRDYLQTQGFVVESIGDAEQPHRRSLIIDYRGRSQATRRLAEVLGLPLSSVVLSPSSESAVEILIILGEDYQPRQ